MLPIFQWMHRGIALVPGSPDARMSLIHVSDLVEAIIACLQSEGAIYQVLTLCDGKMTVTVGTNWPILPQTNGPAKFTFGVSRAGS